VKLHAGVALNLAALKAKAPPIAPIARIAVKMIFAFFSFGSAFLV
jgi:hypothetical protein